MAGYEELVVKIIGDASKLQDALEKASGHVSSFSEKIGYIGKVATIAGTAITGAFALIIKKTADAGDQFNAMSERTGVAVEDLSALAYACNISETSIEGLEIGLKFLTKGMDDAANGTGLAKDAFEYLGISVVDVEGKLRPTIDVLKEAATKIAAIENPTKQAALAMELFGARSGTQLIPLLKMGGAGIEELMKKAKDLGIVISTDTAQAADKFNDALTNLKESLAGVGRDIGMILIPPLTELAEKTIEIIKNIKEWTDAHKPLVEILVRVTAKLGAVIAILGPIFIILPKLKLCIDLLSISFSTFAGAGVLIAVIIGLQKLVSFLEDTIGGMKKLREEVNLMTLEQLTKEIKELEQAAEQLQKRFYEIPKGLGRQEILTMIDEINKRLEILYQQHDKLTKAELELSEATKEVDTTFKDVISPVIELEIKIKEVENATKSLNDKIFELTHTALEVSIKKLQEQRDEYIKLGLSLEKINEWYELEFENLIKLDKKRIDAIVGLGLMAKASGEVAKGIKITATALGGLGLQLKATIDKAITFTSDFMIIFEKLKNDFKSKFVTPVIEYIQDQLAGAIYGLLTNASEFEWSWKSFWEGLKEILINAVAAMIAKLIVLASFSWLFNLIGLPLSWLGINKGGEVGYEKGGQTEYLQFGGPKGTDIIPAWLTPGEYVIAKPMVDFIKRFKAIPGELTKAISIGMPTPMPAFASGGLVGNVSAGSFGTIIHIDIHDNKISDDVDIKKLANTVSNEIVKKLGKDRRF